MKQYLEALKNREDITEEIILELEERFKEVEEEIEDIPYVPNIVERLEMVENTILFMLLGGM